MPSLEIICVNQTAPDDFSGMPFNVEAGRNLVSHRSPKPLFQRDFDKLDGCIYHLLDKGEVTAYDLLRRDWYDARGDSNGLDENVVFKPEYAPAVKQLLGRLIVSSPDREILFTTDYQFGPAEVIKHGPMSLADFWQLHDAGKIRMNASYSIRC